jgi:methyl-accepting chemotaxis protein
MEWAVPVVMVLLMALPQLAVVRTLADIRGEVSPILASAVDAVGIETAGTAGLAAPLGAEVSHRLARLQSTVLTFTAFTGGAMLLLAAAFRLRSKRAFYRLMVELDTVAGEIDSNSYAVKTTGAMLSDDTRRQSEAVVQTAQTHKQIASLGRNNAAHAGKADARIREYAEQIDAANGALQELTASMDEIKHASEDIRKIVDDIDGIAANTNLLAINAGVEAAKAGASGKAFGVIAGEVRKLALRSSRSANQTSAFIESTVEKIDSGAATVGRVVAVFQDTVGQVADIQENMVAISDAAQHQSEQLLGLETALGEIESVTGRNVDNSRRANTISGNLQKNGETLRLFLHNMILANISRRGLNEEVLARMLREIESLVFRLQSMALCDSDHDRYLGQWKEKMGGQVAAIYTCRMDGSFIYSDPPAGIDDARIRPWWQQAAVGKPYMSPVYISAINQRPCCTISGPFFTKNSQIAGVLGVDLKI